MNTCECGQAKTARASSCRMCCLMDGPGKLQALIIAHLRGTGGSALACDIIRAVTGANARTADGLKSVGRATRRALSTLVGYGRLGKREVHDAIDVEPTRMWTGAMRTRQGRTQVEYYLKTPTSLPDNVRPRCGSHGKVTGQC